MFEFSEYTGKTPFGIRFFFEYKQIKEELEASDLRKQAWEQKQKNLLLEKLGLRVFPKFPTCQAAKDYIDTIKPFAHPKMMFSIPETMGSLAF